ncbi:MAG TPA: GNAT family N-acetyltransferase [Pyrinomonadaceae bacterium]|jgi:GNAT superfamily N-acetyltransferase
MGSVNQSLTDDPFKVRKARIEDLPAIAKMAVKLARQHGEYDKQRFDLSIFEPLEPRHLEYLTEQFRREDTSFLVAVVDEDIVGYAFLRIEPQSFPSLDQQGVWLHDIYFEESARRLGLATQFFDAITDEAREMGSRFLMLCVSPKNVAGQKFFAKMGFRPTMQEMRLDL